MSLILLKNKTLQLVHIVTIIIKPVIHPTLSLNQFK